MPISGIEFMIKDSAIPNPDVLDSSSPFPSFLVPLTLDNFLVSLSIVSIPAHSPWQEVCKPSIHVGKLPGRSLCDGKE